MFCGVQLLKRKFRASISVPSDFLLTCPGWWVGEGGEGGNALSLRFSNKDYPYFKNAMLGNQ